MSSAEGRHISIEFVLGEPNHTVASECEIAASSVGGALKTIWYDATDVMITGGTEAAMTRMGLSACQNIKALSTRNKNRLWQIVHLMATAMDWC